MEHVGSIASSVGAGRPAIFDPLANVTAPVQKQDGLDERAVRYGLLPIWDADGLRSSSTYVNFLPSGSMLTFRPFPAHDSNPAETGGHSRLIEVTPFNSVKDMETVYGEKGFRTFPDLALLGEQDARTVMAALWPALPCARYQAELGAGCASCHMADLRENSVGRVGSLPTALRETAIKTRDQLVESLRFGLTRARQEFDIAVNLIKQPQSGKTYLDVPETRAMYHLHETKPELQQVEAAKNYGEQANKGLGAEIAKGLGEFLGKSGGDDETKALLKQLLDQNTLIIEQNDALKVENASLRETVSGLEDLTGPVTTAVKKGGK